MFITHKASGYNRHGEQFASGLFLILVQPHYSSTKYPKPDSRDIRALVRHTTMGQFGNFMMGRARVHGERIILSGSYGGDGLPCMVSDATFERGVPLPAALYDAWNSGGGWNGAGSERDAMRKWALENLAALRA